MDEVEKMENLLSSAAAFVEGGIQDACDDACSICLEAFCDSDPSTVTTCKHEYHLQCILEWCQRSSQCPMCWQPISLKDPTRFNYFKEFRCKIHFSCLCFLVLISWVLMLFVSQELLEAVERERNIRLNQSRPAAIFHHPALGDFELQHLADADFEERIIRHLAAAAAMGRAHHLNRREGQRDRPGSHGRPQFLVFSPHPNTPTIDSASVSPTHRGDYESTPSIIAANPSAPLTLGSESPNQEAHTSPVQSDHSALLTRGTNATASRATGSGSRTPAGQSTPVGQDNAGPSDLQSFSETLKSRLNAVSMRYKESFTKSTRGWRERLFSRNSSVTDIGSEVRREVNAGIATVSRMMERLDTRERRTSGTSGSSNTEFPSAVEQSAEDTGSREGHSNDTSASTSCIATSGPN